MRLVIDTNRIIAALIKDSYSRKIILHLKAELVTISYSQEEIKNHEQEIHKKARLSSVELKILLETLGTYFIFLPDYCIQKNMQEAKKIMDHIDPDDTPFIAAALATGAEIWSDDAHFQKQKRIRIWTTKELVNIL